MKEKYLSPYNSVEDLEKADILMVSPETPATQPTTPDKQEVENAYKDISDFVLPSNGSWF